jgi:glycosyltransferase involved in cell wall biosynthesis
MKVLVVSTSISRSGGGVSEAARLMARSVFLNSDIKVDVLAMADEFSSTDLGQWQDINVALVSKTFLGRYRFAPGMLIDLFATKPQVVHVHGIWQFPCLAVHIWSLVTGRPYVVTPHGMLEPWILTRSPTLKKIVSILYQNSFLRRAAAFQVLTAKERLDIAPYVTGQIVTEIPNYVLPVEGASSRPQWWRPEMEGRDIYLFLGRIHGKKGCLELLDAWASLCDRDPDFQQRSVLVFCGWIDGLGAFEFKVSQMSDAYGNVIYAGPQYGEDKIASICAASFFLLPSKSEGLPMAILEAWSAALPVIMTDECNLSEGFVEGAAIRTEVSPEEIVKSLLVASRLSMAQRDDMGAKGKALVQRRYSQERVGNALVDLYKACVGRARN